jgi:sporulation protein YunB
VVIINRFVSIKKQKIGRKLIAIGLMLIGLIIIVDLRIRPIITKSASYQSRILTSKIINQTLLEELDKDNYNYDNLVALRYSESGEVQSIETNMQVVNRLKAESTQLINEAISQIGSHDLGIATGTISGIQMLYGRGPQIPIFLAPKGYASASLISEFSSAGINQTLHRIVMRVDVDLSAIIPGYTTSVMTESDFIIAETVIVGNIPSSYTHIISENPDLINKAAIFGADTMSARAIPDQ